MLQILKLLEICWVLCHMKTLWNSHRWLLIYRIQALQVNILATVLIKDNDQRNQVSVSSIMLEVDPWLDLQATFILMILDIMQSQADYALTQAHQQALRIWHPIMLIPMPFLLLHDLLSVHHLLQPSTLSTHEQPRHLIQTRMNEEDHGTNSLLSEIRKAKPKTHHLPFLFHL